MTDDFAEIDQGDLGKELFRQPELVREAVLRVAEAKDAYNRARAQLEIAEAEVSLDIRNDPKGAGLPDKPTETAIGVRVLLHKRCREAVARVNVCRHEVDVFEAAVTVLEHKKRALENLVSLHGMGYFAKVNDAKLNDPEVRKQLADVRTTAALGRGRPVVRK